MKNEVDDQIIYYNKLFGMISDSEKDFNDHYYEKRDAVIKFLNRYPSPCDFIAHKLIIEESLNDISCLAVKRMSAISDNIYKEYLYKIKGLFYNQLDHSIDYVKAIKQNNAFYMCVMIITKKPNVPSYFLHSIMGYKLVQSAPILINKITAHPNYNKTATMILEEIEDKSN